MYAMNLFPFLDKPSEGTSKTMMCSATETRKRVKKRDRKARESEREKKREREVQNTVCYIKQRDTENG